MNQAVIDFMRSEIKKGLKQLPEDWQLLFKRMYSYPNGSDWDSRTKMAIDIVEKNFFNS